MKLSYLFVLIFLLLPNGLAAFDGKVAPDISISENYISDKNIYLASLHTWFNATYEKDVTTVSLDQTIRGTVFGDILALGKKIDLSGETYGDVRTFGDTIIISGVINEDLVVIGRHVIVSKEAIINGETLILGHTVEIQGQLLGQSQINASRILVSGEIAGPTTLTGSRINFLSGSKVLSQISYFSPQRAFVDQGVEIQKELNFNQIESIKQNDFIKRLFFGFVSFWAIIKLIATLFVIFVLTHLFKVHVQKSLDSIKENKIQNAIIGFVSFIITPILILILFASLVLIPVSIIVTCIFVILIILLPAMSSIILASIYQLYVQKQQKITVEFNLPALMLIGITFIGFIPYLGAIVTYLLYMISFGTMMRYLYEQIRRRKLNL